MRFRRHNSSPVSFFAFQDVITGVAGVMLIVVLLLIVGKRRNAPSAPPDGSGETLSGLQAQLSDVESRLAHTQARLAEQRLAAEKIAEARQTEQKLRNFAHHGQELSEELERRRSEVRELQTTLQSQQRQIAALPSETRQWLELSSELHELQTAFRRAKLSSIPETRQAVAVLDCARSRWRWTQRGENPVELGGANAVNPTAAWNDLARQLSQLSPSQSLLIVAVRPSAGGFVMPLVQKIRTEFPDLPLALEPMASESAGSILLE